MNENYLQIMPFQMPFFPIQLNLFTGEPEPQIWQMPDDLFIEEGYALTLGEGITLVQSGDMSQLVLSGFGLFLAKKSERLIVKENGKSVYEFPFFRLGEIIIQSHGIAISSDLIEELCEQGIRLSFLGFSGKPYAMLTSPMLSATIQARREQILAYSDKRGVEFSKRIVEGKIKNQAKLLKYFGKYLKQSDTERYSHIEELSKSIESLAEQSKVIEANRIDDARGNLMGLEGTAAKFYWEGVKTIISNKIKFQGREHQGATDPVNILLNYGYGILYSTVWGAVLNAGLEPFAGFLHVDRPGKPSLVLDLVEEFRQPVVDRVVISFINLGEEIKITNGLISQDTRKRFSEKVVERLGTYEPFQGKKYQIKSIIQMQARTLASFLKGQGEYRPFSFKW